MGERGSDAGGESPPRHHWIVVASADHVERGRELGIVQANHGKAAPMRRMAPGDLIAFYSPRRELEGKEPLRELTALARVKEGDVYQGDMGGGFTPWRRDVEFLSAHATPIEPLVEELSFIRDKRRWGYPFRFGLLEIPPADFMLIAEAMGARP